MGTLAVELSAALYGRLGERAQEAGKSPEMLSRELLEEALRDGSPAQESTRDVFQAAGLLSPLSPALVSKILPDVTLDEVHAILEKAGGPSLGEIIAEQCGPKA